MNVRDYWILKLPEVRKQSPSTGKLVESLLINDSKVVKSVLVEMVRLYSKQPSKKLQEAETREDRLKRLNTALNILSKEVKNTPRENLDRRVVLGNARGKVEFIIRRVEKEIYYEQQKAFYNTPAGQKVLRKQEEESLKTMFTKPEEIKSNKEEIQNKVEQEFKEKINEEPTGEELGFFRKIINKLSELFSSIGLKSIWNKVKGLIDSKTKIAMIVGIVTISIILGVYIQKKYGSVGKSILTVITSVLSLGIIAAGIFALRKFFSDVYKLIVHLIETIRNKFRKNTTVQGE